MAAPVTRLTIRGVIARKWRIFLTILAVVSGVAFVSGAFVLTDSVKKSINDLFATLSEGIDLEVRTSIAFGDEATAERDPVSVELIDQISAVEGVRLAEGNLLRAATVIKSDGEPLRTSGPAFGIAWVGPDGLDGRTMVEGRPATGPGEVTLDKSSARRAGYEVGDTVTIVGPTGKGDFALVGLNGTGKTTNGGGASIAAFDPRTANEFLGAKDMVDSIYIAIDEGADRDVVMAAVDAALPDGIEVITGEQSAEETAGAINDIIDIFGNVLLGFAAVSLFVSAFLIFNTFAIIVSQRLRELALLRAVGASSRQIRTMIIGEALVVSVIATVLGIVAGMGVAKGIVAIFNAAGAAFPSASLIVSTRTVVASTVVGVGVTVAAAIVPALRAARIPPVAAMRPELGFNSLQKNKRLVVGSITTGIGLVLFSVGIFGQPGGTSGTLGLSAIGAILLFLGIASLSTTVAAPASRVISRILPLPFRPMTRSVPGRLGSRNAQRTPRRTASTASALMIGLALVSTVSVVASSVQASFKEQLQGSVTADFFVSNGPGNFQGLPVSFSERLSELPELSAVSPFRAATAQVNGDTKQIGAVRGSAFGQLVDIDLTSGSVESLDEGKILLHRDPARDYAVSVGDTLTILWLNGTEQRIEVGGIYDDATIAGNWLVGLSTLQAVSTATPTDFFIGAKIADGVSIEDARAAVEKVALDFPSAEVQDQAEFQQAQEDQLNQLLIIIYGLLIISIAIAVLGIANTMALSVFERTREFGLLRAVGMSKRDLKRSIRWEAVIVAVFGASLGIIVGIPLGLAVTTALPSTFITTTVVPVNTIITILIASIIVGVVAAIGPARRAAKLNVLDAISTH
ncbi:MAG: FtsX-like permease family protein [Actinobacteria bacterium]|nr:FtsX-like permease family protein [Actinomycetota bacterium]